MIQRMRILGNLMPKKSVRERRLLVVAAVATALSIAVGTMPAAVANQAPAKESQAASTPTGTSATPDAALAGANEKSAATTPVPSAETPLSVAPSQTPSAPAAEVSEATGSTSLSSPSSEKPSATETASAPVKAKPSPTALPTPSPTIRQRILASPLAEEPKAAAASEIPLALAAATIGVPVGNPPTDNAKLVVKTGGTRATSTTVNGLAGVTYDFYKVASETVLAIPATASIGSCTTNAAGECGILAVLSGNNNANNYFIAVQSSTSGASQSGVSGTWSTAASWGATADLIRYNSGAVKKNDNAASRIKNMPSSGRTWPTVLSNPVASQKCGIKMAVVFDLSYSVQQSGSVSAYKDAGKIFVDSLAGTPSEIAIKTFASRAPGQNASFTAPAGNSSLGLTSVAQGSGVTTLKNKIDGLSILQNSSDYYTNWDRGLAQIESGYDVVLFLTDGEPTRYGPSASGTGSEATLQNVEEAIHSANSVKATGAKLIAVGIGMGSGENNDTQRLKMISGPNSGSDYFSTDFANLGQTLKTMATKDCLGTVTVVKEIQEPTGPSTPGAQWNFGTSTSNVTAGTSALSSGQTDANGALNFKVAGFITNQDSETRDVSITETQQTGFELVKQTGNFNAKCTNVSTGTVLTITNSGTLGFTVPVKKNDVISCLVTNKRLVSSLTVIKTAAAYNGGNPVTGPGSAPNVPSGTSVTWTYTVKNTGTTTLTNVSVTDDKAGNATCAQTTLAPGATTICTKSGTVTAQQP